MTREKVEGSPLARAKLTLGAAQPTQVTRPQREATPEPDIKTSKHKAAGPGRAMRRTTIYMPEELTIRLKVYAARHREDMSGIIARQVEKLLAEEE
ncbi:MAG TPA: hypothetical protein VH593_04910 [Ktedonobacteraceae bacterium]